MQTITEALAELKTIDKRLEKKADFINRYGMRIAAAKDPFETQGGSSAAIAAELQAVSDLQERKVSIRDAIQTSNQTISLTVNGKTRTVAQWLHWKRDVSGVRQNFLRGLALGIQKAREKFLSQGKTIGKEEVNDPNVIMVHLDELSLQKQIEDLEITLGELDGKLSLINATTTINV